MTLRALLIVALLGAGCATFRCTPTTIIIAEKEERVRMRDRYYGVRTDAGGRAYELRRLEPVTEYWLRSTDDQWYDVTRDAYRAAAPGKLIDVCR